MARRVAIRSQGRLPEFLSAMVPGGGAAKVPGDKTRWESRRWERPHSLRPPRRCAGCASPGWWPLQVGIDPPAPPQPWTWRPSPCRPPASAGAWAQEFACSAAGPAMTSGRSCRRWPLGLGRERCSGGRQSRSEGRGQEGHIGSRKGGNPSPTRSPNAPCPPARSPRNHLPATRRVLIDAGDGPPMEAAVRRQAGRGSMAADTARDDQRTPSSVQWLGVLSAAWIGQFEPTYRSAGAGPGIGVALRGRSNRAMQLSR